MSKKKSKKQPDIVQSTLGDLVKEEPMKRAEEKKTPAKKSSTKKAAPKKKAKPKVKAATKKPKEVGATKAAPKKKAKPKTKTAAQKPKKEGVKKTGSKKKPDSASVSESGIPITNLPGVGSKLADKLITAKYDTVEKISRSRAPSLSKKIDGLSSTGAQNLVDAAKDLLRKMDQPAKSTTEIESEDDASSLTIPLSKVPGIGSKMALALERAGYNSIARLSRSRPDAIALKVEGLSVAGATKIVTEAREMMQRREIDRIIGDSSAPTIIAGKETKPPKEQVAAVKEEIPIIIKEKPVKKQSKKKIEPTVGPSRKKTKVPPPPKRTKPKAIKKSSGLSVPKSVTDLTIEMKEK